MLMRALFKPLLLAVVWAVAFWGNAEAAACPAARLANNTTADATKVMDWLDCKAPMDNPSFNGTLVVTDSGQNQLDMIGNNGAKSQIRTEWEGTGAAGRMMFYYSTISNTLQEGFRLSGLGYVGIGKNPERKLDVDGTIRQTGCTTAGTLAVDSSGDIICSSDARLKNIRGRYAGGLDAISHLNPILFTYKPSKGNPTETFVHAGFIAQEVRAVIPEASAMQRDGYYSLDTTAILAASVNAIKQLKTINESQRVEIQKLRFRLSKLEQVMAPLLEAKRH
jgi:hypothetical protein